VSNRTKKGKPSGKPDRGTSGNPAVRNRHGHKLQLSSADMRVLRDFLAWLQQAETLAAAKPEDEYRAFESVVRQGRARGKDNLSPAGVLDFVEWLLAEDTLDDDNILAALDMMRDYVTFQCETNTDRRTWEEVDDLVDSAVMERFPHTNPITSALQLASEMDPGEKAAALAATLIVAKVPDLLRWIGDGRKASKFGGLRRRHVADLAAILGKAADGESIGVPTVIAWWEALLGARVTKVKKGKVLAGKAAGEWLSGSPGLEQAHEVVAHCVAGIMIDLWFDSRDHGEGLDDSWGGGALTLAVKRLLPAIAPEFEYGPDETLPPDDWSEDRVYEMLKLLERIGLLDVQNDGSVFAQPALRGVIAAGMMASMAMAQDLADVY